MKVLIVDDEPKMCKILGGAIREKGHIVKECTDSRKALEILENEEFDLVITDLRMGNIDGLSILKRVKRISEDCDVFIMTAYATVETAVEALREGASDYLIKPFPVDELIIKIDRLEEKKRLKNELELHRTEEKKRYGEIIGKSKPIKDLLATIEKVAKSDVTVLIYGPSGSGKELVARAIHEKSRRAKGPFIPINCAAITESLLEAELFGYEKGAFTGAVSSKPGRFELAQGGTLFLDEIGELPLSMQAKLLRVLEEHELYRVGGTQPIRVDARLISATNKDLSQLMKEKRFRDDLYFRIAVFPIRVPSLLERKEDIPLIVDHFLSHYGMSINDVDDDVIESFMEYDWPGNVRELKNIIERAVILSEGKRITLDCVPFFPPTCVEPQEEPKPTLMQLERELLLKTLESYNWNKTKAAKALGITRRMLYTRLKKYGLDNL